MRQSLHMSARQKTKRQVCPTSPAMLVIIIPETTGRIFLKKAALNDKTPMGRSSTMKRGMGVCLNQCSPKVGGVCLRDSHRSGNLSTSPRVKDNPALLRVRPVHHDFGLLYHIWIVNAARTWRFRVIVSQL